MSARVRASGAGGCGESLLSLVFTGKEDDLEGGVTYFGKRYLIPALGTWASPDPLAVHSPGKADLNLYAYVSGQLLRAVDPVGLEGEGGAPANYTPATPPLSTSGSTKAAQGDLSSTECTIPMNCATAQADAATQFVGGAAIGATKAMTTIAGAVQHPIETAKVAGPAAAKMVAVLLPSAYNPARDDFVASTAARASAAVGEHYERGTLPQLAGELTGEGAVYTAAGAGVGSAFRAAGPVLRTMAIDSASMATGTLPGSLGRGGAFLVQDVKNTFVYQLVDDVGEAVYYGVTDNPGVRLGGHVEEFGNGFRGMQVISRGVPEAQGRALETSLIEGAKAAGRPIWNIAETSNFKGAAASGIEIPSTIGPSQTMLNPAIYTPRLANQASGSDHGMV